MLRNAEDARDVSQEAFIRLYEAAGSFGGRSKFSTWFYRILVTLCLDQKRKHRWWKLWVRDEGDDRTDPILERQPAPVTDPVDKLSRERTMKELGAAVDRLAPPQRAAVLLRGQGGPATHQNAQGLQCSEAALRGPPYPAVTALQK